MFQTTQWSMVRRARDGEASALNDVVARYRGSVVSFIRGQGCSPEDAEDLAQEVFALVVRDDLLARAEESRGKFRSFLLAVVMNVLRNARRIEGAAKRGGGQKPRPLREVAQEPRSEDDGSLMRALDQLKQTHPVQYEVLRIHIEENLTYAEIAARLSLGLKAVDNLLQAARRTLLRIIPLPR